MRLPICIFLNVEVVLGWGKMARTQDLVGAGLTSRLAYLLGNGLTPATDYNELVVANNDSTNTQGIVVTNPITLTAHLTLTRPLEIRKGGSIITNGFILTINGDFKAGKYQVFTTASTKVIFGAGSADYILPEWFGALGDNTTDDSTAFTIAVNSVPSSHIAIKLQNGKNYRVGGLVCPERTTILGDRMYNSSPVIKYIGSSGFVIQLSTGGVESFHSIKNVLLHGNSAAVTILDINGASFVNCEEVYFINGQLGVDHTDAALFNRFSKCLFGATTTGMKFSAGSNYTSISKCIFQGAQTYCIQTDASFSGDTLNIEECEFSASSCTDSIHIDVVNGYQGKTASIFRCRFDSSPSNSHIFVDDLATVIACENSISGTVASFLKIDGVDCFIDNNALFSSTGAAISLTSNSKRCRIGEQRWGESGSACVERVSDAGTNNTVLNTTLKRTGTVSVISSSTTETDIATITLLADQLWRNRIAKIVVRGSLFNNTGGANGVRLRAKFNGTTLVDDQSMNAIATHATDFSNAILTFYVQNNESQSAQSVFYQNDQAKGAAGAANQSANPAIGAATATTATSADVIMKITAQLSASSANLVWTTSGYHVEYL